MEDGGATGGGNDDDVFFGPWMNFYALEAEEEKRRRRLLTLLPKYAVWMLITTIITKSGFLGISRLVLILLCYIFVRMLVLPPLWTCRLGVILPDSRRHR